LIAKELSDPTLIVPTLKAGGGTDFNEAVQGALRALKLTSDDITPVLIFMTDGKGEN